MSFAFGLHVPGFGAAGLIATGLDQRIEGETTFSIGGSDHRDSLTDRMVEAIREQVALGRSGTPEDAAGAALPMCLSETDNSTGQTLDASGVLNN